MTFIEGLLNLERRFDRVMTDEELGNLNQRDFMDYCREKLWDKIAPEKYGKSYDQLSWQDKQEVDIEALLRLTKALEEIRDKRGSSLKTLKTWLRFYNG